MSEILYSAEQVRELDRCAIEDFNIPSYELMCKAGAVLLDIVQLRWSKAQKILIVCGSGNNAGDGYVLAKLLGDDVETDVYSAFEMEEKLSGDAMRAYRDYTATTHKPILTNELPNPNDYDLIVDALFGSGLCRNIEGHFAEIIDSLNNSSIPVLAVDVPSGLNATTGSICGVAICADVTATFIGRKRGLVTNDGPDCSGQIVFDDLSVPKAVFKTLDSSVQRINSDSIKNLSERAKNAHKGSYGSVLLLGANTGMEGAIALAGQACLRVGAGLVKTAGRASIVHMQATPDLMRADVSDSTELNSLVNTMSVIGVGPGLGTDEWAKACFEIIAQSELPMVLDADALNLLAEKKLTISAPQVLTPHPAEAGRLLGCSTQEIQSDRFSAVLEIAKRYRAVVVLKGCGSLVSDGDLVFICDRGNPSMSCAGMGDVLTGVISGLLAQGLSCFDAAKAGVFLHAVAGDLAEQDLNIGLMASDVVEYIPKVLGRVIN